MGLSQVKQYKINRVSNTRHIIELNNVYDGYTSFFALAIL